jgi:hypothetical protein
LTDDDGARGATANQAAGGERRRKNPEKFHTKLNSCRTAKLRLTLCRKTGLSRFAALAAVYLAPRSPLLEIASVLVRLDHVAPLHR